MTKSISITFEKPEHGWLPVEIKFNDFCLKFIASNLLNNPIKELNDCILNIQNNETRRITWWLEPSAYFFDFERKGNIIILKILETNNLHRISSNKELLITIEGNQKEIIEPFNRALNQFHTMKFEENHWSATKK